MLKCREIAADASHFVDGNASLFEKVKFYFHLVLCVHCRRFIRHLSLTRITAGRIAARKQTLGDDEAGRIVETATRPSQED